MQLFQPLNCAREAKKKNKMFGLKQNSHFVCQAFSKTEIAAHSGASFLYIQQAVKTKTKNKKSESTCLFLLVLVNYLGIHHFLILYLIIAMFIEHTQ